MHMSDGAAKLPSARAQDVQAAQREAAQQAQQAQQQAQRELQQAQREVQQAQREAQQAQQDAQREAQQAQREAQQAVRQMQAELARNAREGQAVAFPPLPPIGPQIPDGVVVISIAFFVMCAVIAIGVPLVRAFTRRMDRRNAAVPGADAETRDRLERIEQAVDAIAVEVERISEGQRFTTKVISELRGLPQPDPSAALAERAGDRGAAPLSRAREAR